jgi:hypothetical protein
MYEEIKASRQESKKVAKMVVIMGQRMASNEFNAIDAVTDHTQRTQVRARANVLFSLRVNSLRSIECARVGVRV